MDTLGTFYPPLATVPSKSVADPMRSKAAQLLYVLVMLWGASIVWLSPHPPMVDLPQHAGQVVLLRDLLFGNSPWSDMFRINLLTPYLIGYGIALPLSMVMPIAAALKLMLSLAYIAFVLVCIMLRRHFGGDARLDWLFLVPFFGFAFKWGFFTFLISTPLGLLFIYLADRYAVEKTRRMGWAVLATGTVLLLSHGLVFLFGMIVGVALFFGRKSYLQGWKLLAPYAGLFGLCVVYFLVNQQVNQGMQTYLMGTFSWSLGISRPWKALMYSVGPNSKDGYITIKVVGVALLFLLPWVLGLRIAWEEKIRCVPFAIAMLVFSLTPDFAWNTAFLYQRFAIYVLPTYALMFTGQPMPAHLQLAKPNNVWARRIDWIFSTLRPYAILLALFGSGLVLAVNSMTFWQFRKESSDFDQLISQLQPRQRAAAIVLDQRSDVDRNDKIYAHYPLWYQAEDDGLVDFNFAWFPPQIVRYRPDRLPGIKPGFDWFPHTFSWKLMHGERYDYFFVRHLYSIPGRLFMGAPCPPQLVKTSGFWSVYKPGSCQPH